jgi:hypothetical protein
VTAAVTPLGVRDGDPDAVAALVRRRGGAVLGYCEEVAAPGEALQAAADAFTRFRAAVATAPEAAALDAERELVRAMRFAAAERAPRADGDAGSLRRASGRSDTGRLVPTLLAARAEGDLGPEDEERLTRLLARSGDARGAAERMRRGETAYTDHATELAPHAAGPIVAALLTAPARGTVPDTIGRLGAGLGWSDAQVREAIAASGAPGGESPTQQDTPRPERDLVAAVAPAGGAAVAAPAAVGGAAAAGTAAAGATPPERRRRRVLLAAGLAVLAALLAVAVLAIAGVFGGDDETAGTAGNRSPAATQPASTAGSASTPASTPAPAPAAPDTSAARKAGEKAARERAAKRRAAERRAARRRAARRSAAAQRPTAARTPASAPSPRRAPAPTRTPSRPAAPSHPAPSSSAPQAPSPGATQVAPSNGAANVTGGVPPQPEPSGTDLAPPPG